MRITYIILALTLAACVSPPMGQTRSTSLVSADASTSLIAGERLTAQYVTHPAQGDDPLVVLTLHHADGRVLAFEEANHAPDDVRAQAAGGPLAQVMGLFGDEAPRLYHARSNENHGAPFLCGPDGPANIGVYEAADGGVQVVGLKQSIEFETRPDGTVEALPYSPDQVCARLRFRRG